jgi:hypothetical protein
VPQVEKVFWCGDERLGSPLCPAVGVTWFEAEAHCRLPPDSCFLLEHVSNVFPVAGRQFIGGLLGRIEHLCYYASASEAVPIPVGWTGKPAHNIRKTITGTKQLPEPGHFPRLPDPVFSPFCDLTFLLAAPP